MSAETALEQIEREVRQLPPDQQLRLVERIVHGLREVNPDGKRDLNWDEIYGIAKDLWNGEDAQEYVNRLREDRECP